MKPVDNGLGGNADSGNEELSATLDDDVDEFVELSLCVIVANRGISSAAALYIRRRYKDLLCLARASTDLRKEKVDTEWSVFVVQEALQLGNLVTEHFRSVSDTSDDTESTGVGDGRGQLGPGSHVHSCQQDRVVDLEQISEGSLDFLYKTTSA